MKKEFLNIGGRDCPVIRNAVKIGDWEEVKSIPVSTITKRDTDTALLNGLIIKGYEMEWDKTNGNYERYEKTAFDKFIQEYFVDRGFNLPVDIQHYDWIEALAGRVIYAEINTRGFYYVVYIPRTYVHYEIVLNLLREGILQGFSKMGYATDWKWVWDEETGDFDYELIKEFKLLSVSLVTTPANGIPFERLQETKQNALVFKNTTIKEIENANTPADEMARMFNN